MLLSARERGLACDVIWAAMPSGRAGQAHPPNALSGTSQGANAVGAEVRPGESEESAKKNRPMGGCTRLPDTGTLAGMRNPTIGVFYGSTTGNTEDAAREIVRLLCQQHNTDARLHDISGMNPQRLLEFDRLILGCPTWDVGELQSDWECLLRRLEDLRLDGRRVALFGSGDAACYPETFQDAMGILGAVLRERGATLVGSWPTDGFDFDASRGVENDRFLGLPLDIADSRRDIELRAAAWLKQVLRAFDSPEN